MSVVVICSVQDATDGEKPVVEAMVTKNMPEVFDRLT
jgi:hypothetical protein